MTPIDLTGRIALVTGANRGIGAVIARRLARAGAHVVVTARHLDGAEAVAADIRATGGSAEAAACDVTHYAAVAAVVEESIARHGRIDILVNNAGSIEPIARMADSDPAAWDAIVDVNLKGVYHGIRAVLPGMVARGSGTIIAMNSGAANAPMDGWSHYCATKAAVQMLTRHVHKEYGELGIRSIGLSPGPIAGPMQGVIRASGLNPVSRLTDADYSPPEWAAEAVAWLCTSAADAYLGTDFSIKIDQGRHLIGVT
jgi:3-oxoacyl-[acyl-carrier protein] reductase